MNVPTHPPEEPVILALDQGTHASRALLVNPRGEVLSTHKYRVGLTRHGPNAVEQDPNEILTSLKKKTIFLYSNVHILNAIKSDKYYAIWHYTIWQLNRQVLLCQFPVLLC